MFQKNVYDKKTFILKSILDEDNLRQYFRIRYQVYVRMKYVDTNEDRLDIDSWDFSSKFFAAFEKESNKLVGTLRFIYKDLKCDGCNVVSEITKTLKDQKFKAMSNLCEFPLMQAFNIDDFLESCYLQKRKVVEVGRLTVLPRYWKHGLASVLAEFAVSHAYQNKLDDCIIAVHPRHARMYESLGFKFLPNTKEVVYPGINNAAIAMHLDFSKVNEPHHSRALEMQQSVIEKGYFEINELGRRKV